MWEAWAQGKIAPSAMVKFLLGITKSGSTSNLWPKPWQAGQAPKGELKEKSLGSNSGKEIEHFSQAKCSEKIELLTITMPLPNFKAVSMESTNLGLSRSLSKTKRSTTTSILCFLFLSKVMFKASSVRWMALSILTLTNPALCISSRMPRCSPFLPLITGPKIMISVLGFIFKTCSVIWSTVWRTTGLPHLGQ